jgi:hypothetical protein
LSALSRIEELERTLKNVVASITDQPVQQQRLPPPPASKDLNIISEREFRASAASGNSESNTGSPEVRVDEEQAWRLLDKYRQMSRYFPFVLIPKSATVSELSQSNPMVLKAIFVTASWENSSLQKALELEYVKTLTKRIYLDGEKSLDLLQSLLIYLAW